MSRVYLIGLPGSGKTHTGRWLAEKMEWDFIDLDEEIEQSTGKAIRQIFEEHGEEVFRGIEKERLRATSSMRKVVVSCGGGAAAWEDNMEWMNRNGLTLFLNPDNQEILERLEENANERPLFKGLSREKRAEKLSELVEKRGIYHHKAKMIWNKAVPEDKLYIAVNQLVDLYPLMA